MDNSNGLETKTDVSLLFSQVLGHSLDLHLPLECPLLLLPPRFILPALRLIQETLLHVPVGVSGAVLQVDLRLPLLQYLCQQERALWRWGWER